MLEPKLLVADEPVSMLDVSVRAGILDLLDGLRRSGLGILMITHDLSTAAHYADRILVMYLGRIVEEGPARAVVDNPQHPYTRALISVVPRRDPHDLRRPQILQGETPNPVDIPAGCRFRPRCPIGDDACRAVDPQLDSRQRPSSGLHQAMSPALDDWLPQSRLVLPEHGGPAAAWCRRSTRTTTSGAGSRSGTTGWRSIPPSSSAGPSGPGRSPTSAR